MSDPAEASILVPANDPKKTDKDKSEEQANGANGSSGKGKGKDVDGDGPDMSEEDIQLKGELEMLVERLKEQNTELYTPSLESLRTLIRTSTSSMTSVPKPLKFLRPHYEELGRIRDRWSESLRDQRSLLASILSVLAMTYSDTGLRETLYYRVISGSSEAPGLWGHEYVRHLAAELGEEYNARFNSLLAEEAGERPEANGTAQTNGASEANGVNGHDEPHASIEKKKEYSVDQLRGLALELVDFFLGHNAEADAVDLMLELECVEKLVDKVDDKTWPRVCQYMVHTVPLLVAPDDRAFLETAARIYAKNDRYPEALALAVRLNDRTLIQEYFEAPRNPVMKKQLAYSLARSQVPLRWVHTVEGEESDPSSSAQIPTQDEVTTECLTNQKLSEYFRGFGKAVGVDEPRSVEDVYKTHLEPTSRSAPAIDSARANLATTFVNAFVNAGFCNEKLLAEAEDGQSWIYKNKDHGILCASASLGVSLLWNHDRVSEIDKYTYHQEEQIKAGGILALGIAHSRVTADPDIVFPLLEEHINSKSLPLKISAINGLAISYAGSCREDIKEALLPHVADETNTMEVASMAALALGFIFVGSGDGDVASGVLQTLMEREEAQLEGDWAVFMGLALGLIFLGTQDAAEATIETLRAIEHPLSQSAQIIVDVCAFAGTGNVLKVQEMLHICAEHAEKKKKPTANAVGGGDGATPDPATAAGTGAAAEPGPGAPGVGPDVDVEMDGEGAANGSTTGTSGGAGAAPNSQSALPVPLGMGAGAAASLRAGQGPAGDGGDEDEEGEPKPLRHQAFATIGIALIAMGEEVGAEMALRQFQHLMTYGDPTIRRSVPLALGLISASNPQLSILDTLSKYSHDSDLDVAINSILAMGLVGAGTNNARLGQMLRGLAGYYAKEADCLFITRIAQGLVHMGKGTIGINPFFNDRQIMSRTAVAGLLSVIVAFTDARKFVLGKQTWMLFWLVTAMYPQLLITLDEDLQEKAVTMRVGQAVNTVGLAGTRMGISGFQTHQTPVRIGTGERAELGTNEFFPYQSVLEGLVILRKNEGYDADD